MRNSIILYEFTEFGVFMQILYSLEEQTNQYSKIIAPIGQYSASLWILKALANSSMLVASSTLVIIYHTNYVFASRGMIERILIKIETSDYSKINF